MKSILEPQAGNSDWYEFVLGGVSSVFNIEIAKSLDKCELTTELNGVNYISRRSGNNGLEMKVQSTEKTQSKLNKGQCLTMVMLGCKGTAFWQNEDFYASQNMLIIRAPNLTKMSALFIATLLKNKYGGTDYAALKKGDILKDKLWLPAQTNSDGTRSPDWAHMERYIRELLAELSEVSYAKPSEVPVSTENWKLFLIIDLFELKKGKRLTKQNMTVGATPFVSASAFNNGITQYIGQTPNHAAGTISVCYDGSVGESFYQPTDYWASDSVSVFYPKFEMSPELGLALATVIRTMAQERYGYTHKWNLARMEKDSLLLPVKDGKPDFEWLAQYMSALELASRAFPLLVAGGLRRRVSGA